MSKTKKPILITGSHRSGTTWVGQMLSANSDIGYIFEPFNKNDHLGNLDIDSIEHWFMYVDETSSPAYQRGIAQLLRFQYPLRRNIRKIKNIQDLARVVKHQSIFMFNRMTQKRPLIKDPIAFFSAEWLHRTFDMEIVVLVRHPAAFCSSLKIKNWRFDFNDFLDQPQLMDRYLDQYRDQIQEYAAQEKDTISQAILLWNCIHATILEYQRQYPHWHFVRHEDLSIDPISEFKALYHKLDIEFGASAEKAIHQSSGMHNPTEQTKNEFLRNSKENIKNWKNRLSTKEIEQIKKGTFEISQAFYQESSWI